MSFSVFQLAPLSRFPITLRARRRDKLHVVSHGGRECDPVVIAVRTKDRLPLSDVALAVQGGIQRGPVARVWLTSTSLLRVCVGARN
ncbi:hypothetical protein, unknown function [Leishmania tarentolae]|uniref:Uncharacterized protein n=1 Tax=Leishmania tarentolae TaxID=5689 RepID=A0A640L2H1_LEITA|nr:hypothetical protein, unknown function [Leishmania tarentolae]GET90666.1 hypothetical protein, unknown function [Leishmania tarentolae]GET94007.1 hypothetical protein, unknown function [Leishmania tarentolae]GET94011.1 hypothetical protein, unknown function [Leishmania tarentolae]